MVLSSPPWLLLCCWLSLSAGRLHCQVMIPQATPDHLRPLTEWPKADRNAQPVPASMRVFHPIPVVPYHACQGDIDWRMSGAPRSVQAALLRSAAWGGLIGFIGGVLSSATGLENRLVGGHASSGLTRMSPGRYLSLATLVGTGAGISIQLTIGQQVRLPFSGCADSGAGGFVP